ncbi:hypothetical protein PUNSTDRAFT_44586 [Punctularia strigosozonata HHB-11173 SS5]|uniref:uncharacterized protein n=1 Tax=Punctularia strigosozonata (strain HHB-11173) TaxID=741275 RepID=UPI0004418738|nr:uncharacterized protein PUNSTDRAFT_44586 [Punctularia strigosozonata HHB-11173 SS5]EIN09168.1 hypothetical protein PUNSTDRAFT_44586 [Punctularia strigosozonata HHB-11173 SS5]
MAPDPLAVSASSKDTSFEPNRSKLQPEPASSPLPSLSSSTPTPHKTYLERTPSKSKIDSLDQLPSKDENTQVDDTPVPAPAAQLARTASHPAKDLSALFDLASSFSTPAKPKDQKQTIGGLASRMLSRSSSSLALSDSGSQPKSPGIAGGSRTGLGRTGTVIDLTLASQSQSQSSSSSSFGRSSSSLHGVLGQARHASPTRAVESVAESSSPARPAVAPVALTTVRRTYAGASRSFLMAVPAAQYAGVVSQLETPSADGVDGLGGAADVLATSQEEDDNRGLESYADLRARLGVDLSDDPPPQHVYDSPPRRDGRTSPQRTPSGKWKGKAKETSGSAPELPPGMMNDLKSITELRSKGESRRFLDEVGYLFEGLLPESEGGEGGLGVRRGSALDLMTKFSAPDFMRKAKATDFPIRAWRALRGAGAGDGDKFLDAVAAYFAALITHHVRAADMRELFDGPEGDFVPVLFDVLERTSRAKDALALVHSKLMSDAELRKAGISRSDKSLFAALDNLATKESGLFERGTAGTPTRERFESDAEKCCNGLIALVNAAHVLSSDGDESEGRISTFRNCVDLAFRVLVNLSHSDSQWCDALARHELGLSTVMRTINLSYRGWTSKQDQVAVNGKVKRGRETTGTDATDPGQRRFDSLCLALCLLTNLVHQCSDIEQWSLDICLAPACLGHRACMRACRCLRRKSALEGLSDIYSQCASSAGFKPESGLDLEAVACSGLLASHLAVLFGLIMKAGLASEARVLALLQGQSRVDKLSRLVEVAGDFVSFQEAVSVIFLLQVGGDIGYCLA